MDGRTFGKRDMATTARVLEYDVNKHSGRFFNFLSAAVRFSPSYLSFSFELVTLAHTATSPA